MVSLFGGALDGLEVTQETVETCGSTGELWFRCYQKFYRPLGKSEMGFSYWYPTPYPELEERRALYKLQDSKWVWAATWPQSGGGKVQE